MASKLDQAIGNVAIALGQGHWARMMPMAIDAAHKLTPHDVAKLPDRWHPSMGAGRAGAPELKDGWDHLWFEAVSEILSQSGEAGLEGLLVLMDRNESTYHQYVIVRLLRLAADGVEPDMILDRVRSRLETLRLPGARFVVQEVEAWKPVDPRPFTLLESMSAIEIPGSDGDTISTHMNTTGPDRRAEP
jgi:hypothetical protein